MSSSLTEAGKTVSRNETRVDEVGYELHAHEYNHRPREHKKPSESDATSSSEQVAQPHKRVRDAEQDDDCVPKRRDDHQKVAGAGRADGEARGGGAVVACHWRRRGGAWIQDRSNQTAQQSQNDDRDQRSQPTRASLSAIRVKRLGVPDSRRCSPRSAIGEIYLDGRHAGRRRPLWVIAAPTARTPLFLPDSSRYQNVGPFPLGAWNGLRRVGRSLEVAP